MKYTAFKEQVRPLPLISSGTLAQLSSNAGTLKVQLSQWKKKGLISSLRKGLYVLNKHDRSVEPSSFYLANQIFIPSYVSLESALAYYGLIPEFVSSITSITVRKTCTFKNEFGVFNYRHVKPAAYTGFVSVQESQKMSVLMALPEKAVVDFMYLNLSDFDAKDEEIFEQSYRFQNCENLDSKKLKAYANYFNTRKLKDIVETFIKTVIR